MSLRGFAATLVRGFVGYFAEPSTAHLSGLGLVPSISLCGNYLDGDTTVRDDGSSDCPNCVAKARELETKGKYPWRFQKESS